MKEVSPIKKLEDEAQPKKVLTMYLKMKVKKLKLFVL